MHTKCTGMWTKLTSTVAASFLLFLLVELGVARDAEGFKFVWPFVAFVVIAEVVNLKPALTAT